MEYENPKVPELDYSSSSPFLDFIKTVVTVGAVFLTAFIVLSFVFGHVFALTPFSYEKKLGDKIWGLPEDGEERIRLQKIADLLSKEMGLEGIITIHYDTSSTVNAYATLGGHIVVYKGIYEKLKDNEDALYLLMAHEMAHIKHRDVARSMSKQLLGAIFVAAVDVNIIEVMVMFEGLSYSRAIERNADSEALRVLSNIGVDISSALKMFEALAEENSIDLPNFMLTHDNLEDRVKELKEIYLN